MKKYIVRKSILYKFKIALCLLVLSGLLVMSTIPSSADKEVLISEAGQYIQVIVHPGDSLWKIARNHGNKQNDIRKIIYEIKKINQLESSTIHPGQIILMPKN